MSKKFLTWLLACLCVTALSAGVACGGEDNSVSSSQESVASTDSSFIESSSSEEESSFIAENSSIEESFSSIEESSSVEEDNSSIEEENSSIEEDSSSEMESIYSEDDSSIEEDSSNEEDDSSIEEESSSIEEDSFSEPAHVHSYWDQGIKTPGCVEVGEKKFTCACGENYIEEIPAKGHNYAFGDSQYIQESDQWIVSLKCDCGAWTVATGEFSHMVDATCINSGYSVYVYSYDNGIGEIKTEEIHAFLTGKSNKHTFTDGENTIQIKQGESLVCNNVAIRKLLEKGIIRWAEGEPGICTDKKLAGGDCSICGALVTFYLSGLHILVCDKSTLDTNALTVSVYCRSCGEHVLHGVPVEYEYVKANPCGISYHVYKTVGLDESYEIRIQDEENHIPHTFTDGENTIQIKQGALVNYKDVKELINSGTIRLSEGEAECNEVTIAGAYCSLCGDLITFNVQKEHDFEYKTGSLNEETMTVIFACECRESIEVSVIEIDYVEGDCLHRPYYVYQTVGLSEEQVIHIYDDEAHRAAPHLLVLKTEEGETHYAEFVNGEKYQYNDTIEAFMDAGLLLWAEIEPEHCNRYQMAVFNCERCGNLVVIHLSGKHVFNDEGRCESCGEEQKNLFE